MLGAVAKSILLGESNGCGAVLIKDGRRGLAYFWDGLLLAIEKLANKFLELFLNSRIGVIDGLG